MRTVLSLLLGTVRRMGRARRDVLLENVALRHQLAKCERRPRVEEPGSPLVGPGPAALAGVARRCLDHLIPLSERHLRWVITESVADYNATHPTEPWRSRRRKVRALCSARAW